MDKESIRQQFASVDQSHFQYAPKEARTIWSKWTEAINTRDEQQARELKVPLRAIEDECLQKLCDILDNTAPEASLELLYGEHNDRLFAYTLPRGGETFSLARGAWLIGVFGNGQDSTKSGAHKAFNKYVRWVATRLMGIHMDSILPDDDADGVHNRAVGQLEISRLVEPETRMMWVTDEITSEIGKWSDENVDNLSGLNGLNSETTTQISENIKRATDRLRNERHSMTESFSDMLLESVPDELVRALTASRRSISATNIEKAMLSDDPNALPFACICDKHRVLGRSGWLFQRDDALFRLCMQASPRHSEGKVFEDVTAALLQKWGPSKISWQSAVVLTDASSSKNPDDVDLFGTSKTITFIGECKANRLSENNSSVSSNFENVVLSKASSQLKTRISHWNDGWRPHKSGGSYAESAIGFITTYSSYGGLLWNPSAILPGSDAGHFGIFPLYSLVLVACLTKTPAELRDYLDFRLEAMSQGVKNLDELEYVLWFFSSEERRTTKVPDDATILLRQYELSQDGVWIDPRAYRKCQNWKEKFLKQLWNLTDPVTPALA